MKQLVIFVTLIFILGTFSLHAEAKFSDKVDGEFVTLTGKVSDVTAESFNLNVDGQKIFVEMDDYDWDADGYKLVNGDQVVVSGRVDQDFLEGKKIEAGSVYVKNLNTYFYANSDDEEFQYVPTTVAYVPTLPDGAYVDMQGKVTKTSGRKFTLDTGLRRVTVDTKALIYDPMDNTGYTKIDKGDRVRVSGRIDQDYIEGKELEAASVLEL